MKDNTRSQNRHHAERVKNKRSRYQNAHTTGKQDVAIGKVACTPAMCSCYMCGNPRKHFSELTHQEKKFVDKMEEGIISADEKPLFNSKFSEPQDWFYAEIEWNKVQK